MVWLDMVEWRWSERSFVDILVGLDRKDILNEVVWVVIFEISKCCKGMTARKPSILPFSTVTRPTRNIDCVCHPAAFTPLHKCNAFSTVLRLDIIHARFIPRSIPKRGIESSCMIDLRGVVVVPDVYTPPGGAARGVWGSGRENGQELISVKFFGEELISVISRIF